MAILVIEGQEHEIDDAFANLGSSVEESDQLLRNALRGQFDIIANATFRRETSADGALKITVIKNPGTKGAANGRLLLALLGAQDCVNPAYLLDCQLRMEEAAGNLDLPMLLGLQSRIRSALAAGRVEEQETQRARKSLLRAVPPPAALVPLGF